MTLFALFVAGVSTLAGFGATPDADRKERAAGLVFSVPRDAMVTSQISAKGVETVAVSWGDEVVLITLYSGDKRPKPRRALEVHREELERRVIERAVRDTSRSLSELCRVLGISRNTLYRKLKKYKLR